MRILIILVFTLSVFPVFSGWDEVSDASRRGDHEAATDELRHLAEGGDLKAQFFMSISYRNAKGVEKDWGKADEWLLLAARNGYLDAQFTLGACYSSGNFKYPIDYEKSAYWMKKAAEQGFANAQYHLATHYSQGQGVDKNVVIAYAWMRTAESNYPKPKESDTPGRKKHRETIISSRKDIERDMTEKELVESEILYEEYMRIYSKVGNK